MDRSPSAIKRTLTRIILEQRLDIVTVFDDPTDSSGDRLMLVEFPIKSAWCEEQDDGTERWKIKIDTTGVAHRLKLIVDGEER